ncbi:MAG: GHKL domain-containing protein [Desulfobacterales bacterium]|nr:GHKL domain-containing protein [Desulfobacterales bacterium]
MAQSSPLTQASEGSHFAPAGQSGIARPDPSGLSQPLNSEFLYRIKLLMFIRVIFTSLLLGSTIILQLSQMSSPTALPLLMLYGLIAGIFLISVVYVVLLGWMQNPVRFAYLQTSVDTLIVTAIVFVTGSFASIFSFLYMVVIIYTSMLLYRRGSLIMAGLCSIEYGAMIGLEYYSILKPFVMDAGISAVNYSWTSVFYKIVITMVACFAVGWLSGLLSEQTRKTRTELRSLEDHIRRVERLASMGEMAAGMAHEIKNPLASLAGSIQLLKETFAPDPSAEKLMQIVRRETDRLSDLLNGFLLFARPPAGKARAIDLGAALDEIVSLFRKDNTRSDRIHIRSSVTPGIWIEMDPVHLRQVLWNLLLNAAEAIDDTGTVDIHLDILKSNKARMAIIDTGCGIPREQIGAIFDPFFTTKPNGTGLGLSMVHGILESYDCRLDVDSEMGRGTQFTLIFNRIEPSEP